VDPNLAGLTFGDLRRPGLFGPEYCRAPGGWQGTPWRLFPCSIMWNLLPGESVQPSSSSPVIGFDPGGLVCWSSLTAGRRHGEHEVVDSAWSVAEVRRVRHEPLSNRRIVQPGPRIRPKIGLRSALDGSPFGRGRAPLNVLRATRCFPNSSQRLPKGIGEGILVNQSAFGAD
jgi:hypothetical protein